MSSSHPQASACLGQHPSAMTRGSVDSCLWSVVRPGLSLLARQSIGERGVSGELRRGSFYETSLDQVSTHRA